MFEETPERPAQDRDPVDLLSEVLEKYENRPLLKKIEKNTAVLPTLLRALTVTMGARAAHFYVRDTPKPHTSLRQAVERSVREPGIAPARVASPTASTTRAASVAVQSGTVTTPAPASSDSPAPANPQARTAATERTRTADGRFLSAGQRERERQNEERQASGVKGWIGKALGLIAGKGAGKGADVEDAVGKAAGGPIWEAAKEMQGAVGELREKLQDEKTLMGKSFGWLKKKTGRNAPPTEGTEQQRHRETIRAIEGNAGGGGDGGGGGIADAIAGYVGGRFGGKLLSKIPGAGIAANFLTKAGPLLKVLTAGTTVAAVGTLAVAAAGFAGIMNIINRGKDNGWHDPLTPDQSKAIDPKQTKGPSKEEKESWDRVNKGQYPIKYDPATGAAIPHPFDPVINSSSKKNGIDPALTKAVIAVESGGKITAESKAGAQGLMQLMPKTAKALRVNPLDPKANIKGGTAHLGRLMKKYDGNEKVALQAYNWGEGNMDAYLKTGKGAKGQPMPKETINYPGKVQRNKSVAPANGNRQQVSQPTALQGVSVPPITAQLLGTEQLIAALNKQSAPRQETAAISPIKKHYDDTMLNLMAHDRI